MKIELTAIRALHAVLSGAAHSSARTVDILAVVPSLCDEVERLRARGTCLCGEGCELDGKPVGCGDTLWLDRPTFNGFRCVDCKVAFCERCIREHFRRHKDEATDAVNVLLQARRDVSKALATLCLPVLGDSATAQLIMDQCELLQKALDSTRAERDAAEAKLAEKGGES